MLPQRERRILDGTVEETLFKTPIGIVAIAASENGVCQIQFTDRAEPTPGASSAKNPHLLQLTEELARYFAGCLTRFTCSIDPSGTAFQRRVWSRLAAIPYGATRTYGQIAHEIGQPRAARAVGGANNRNPLPIVVPCHRVIGSSHKLVGFAGGLWRKQWMLEHEGIAVTRNTVKAG